MESQALFNVDVHVLHGSQYMLVDLIVHLRKFAIECFSDATVAFGRRASSWRRNIDWRIIFLHNNDFFLLRFFPNIAIYI